MRDDCRPGRERPALFYPKVLPTVPGKNLTTPTTKAVLPAYYMERDGTIITPLSVFSIETSDRCYITPRYFFFYCMIHNRISAALTGAVDVSAFSVPASRILVVYTSLVYQTPGQRGFHCTLYGSAILATALHGTSLFQLPGMLKRQICLRAFHSQVRAGYKPMKEAFSPGHSAARGLFPLSTDAGKGSRHCSQSARHRRCPASPEPGLPCWVHSSFTISTFELTKLLLLYLGNWVT